ncbi:EcsC family protein [Brachybacterium sp. EF45031]|uniref:EcsC family protein n=1 Tax=Brachybacterium sillae TaxID=2810536 RepID=UPI00217D82C8|nr:EcsC family protein [Brachybacterium sillae]MCS6711176.1 EcsC family protein [Brachybacterium sillae]
MTRKSDAAARGAQNTALTSTSGDGREGRLDRFITDLRDKGIDGTAGYASADAVARKALRKAGVGKSALTGSAPGRAATAQQQDKAIRHLVRAHRRTVTLGGFVTGLGGIVTLPVMLPANLVEYTVQASRLAAAIAIVRGHDADSPQMRDAVLATLLGDEAFDVMRAAGVSGLKGLAGRAALRRLPGMNLSPASGAIATRLLKRFSLHSVRVFGKAIPLLGAVLGAWSDRRQLKQVVGAATEAFPARG